MACCSAVVIAGAAGVVATGGAGVVMTGAGVVATAVGAELVAGAATAAGFAAEPQAARLIPAASVMAGTAMSFLLSFIVLPSPSAESLISLSVNRSLRSVHSGTQGRMTRKSEANVT
jgi:hypothetical protein